MLEHMPEGKDSLRTNVWKVYQILLESACKTDYQMITKQLEENNVREVNALHEKMDDMTKHIVQQEDELQHAVKDMMARQEEIEVQKAKLEEEKMRLFNEFHNQQKKLEDEIELRLFFEQKLNSLHSINMKHETQNKLLMEKHEKLQSKISRLDAEN